ncbi:hypothetical protein [Weissella bombi]|uniref:Uncharacterized protein n=1 Tax=Weissella bombi TaxID=1505725 RepID=A0A1C3ZHZ6_9LACO|nr:hypothetical protein [Weissella bombi]SCB81971.1 hypothetical protein GA0061074_10217 [Weissella bombi]
MTKQFRDNLIGLIAAFIFIVVMFMTDHLVWLLLIIFGPSLLITWLLNKYKPLRKGPEIAWWKAVLINFSAFFIVLIIVKVRLNDPIFSFESLIALIVFPIANALGILSHRSNPN